MATATPSTLPMSHAPSYIVASATAATSAATTASPAIEATSLNTPQALSDIKLICSQRKKRIKRHIYLTFVESRPLSSAEQPCIEITRKSNSSSSQQSIYPLNECISFEYFDTVKNDFQAFIYVYFESYTISIAFAEESFEKKSLIIKHLEYMHQSKNDKANEINNNSTSDSTLSPLPGGQVNSTSQQAPILPCSSTTEQILHTFDINLIPYGPIIHRDHALVGPARLYFTTTDLYIASIHCNRTELKVTIANQCPSKDKAILCIPYFTIKNYGNRSNIFLIELGKSNYGNGEIHMKCTSSSLASTIHLLVSPVIEERPLILSSAFQNQLLTNKRIEKSKNFQPPVQLSHEPAGASPVDSPLPASKKKSLDINPNDASAAANPSSIPATTSSDLKSSLVVGFLRTLTKNVSHLRRSATFHHQQSQQQQQQQQQQTSGGENHLLPKSKYVGFPLDEKTFQNDQHPILLPESQKKSDSISTTSSNLTKRTNETLVTSLSTATMSTTKQEPTIGTYIDMGPTVHKPVSFLEEKVEYEMNGVEEEGEEGEEEEEEERTATAEIGVNTTISLSPYVRSAIIVGNSVHLIADEKSLPIGPRSFTSPASVMQPFKTQLNGKNLAHPHAISTDLITSAPNSSSSLHQTNSEKSLLLSYGMVTFNNNEYIATDPTDRPISPPSDGSTLDQRLNSDLSLTSAQQQNSTTYSLDNILSASNAHIVRAISVSAITDTMSGQIRAPHGSIFFFDDHLADPLTATAYLLGAPPSSTADETVSANLSRLSSFNLTPSISRPYLSNIDEEKSSPHDPYALHEPAAAQESPAALASIVLANPSSLRPSLLNYADLLLPAGDLGESTDQQHADHSEENHEEGLLHVNDKEDESNGLATNIYTDIDFHQTQRRDRILQSAAKAKKEDQTPPFVL